MCGNGARCVARLAHEIGAAPASMTIETPAGRLGAERVGDQVRLGMTAPCDWRLNQTLTVDGEPLRYSYVNTGVPHVVVEADPLDAVEVQARGQALRQHACFAPQGANVNFVQRTGPRRLRIRTYERGVEAETLACGTGMVAAALVSALGGRVEPPVEVVPVNGDRLTVDFTLRDGGAENVTLLGPAVHVFQGERAYPA